MQVCRACGVSERPNSCNANLYEAVLSIPDAFPHFRFLIRLWAVAYSSTSQYPVYPMQDETDSVGWHADDESWT